MLRTLSALGIVVALAACSRPQPDVRGRAMIWHVPAVAMPEETATRHSATTRVVSLGALITIDSASLAPALVRLPGAGFTDTVLTRDTLTFRVHSDYSRMAIVTTWQGGRYHPETIRAVAADSVVMFATARRIAESVSTSASGVLMDFQNASRDDLPGMVDAVGTIRTVLRARRKYPVGMVIPTGDTVVYPTEILARVSDVLVIRLHGQHRPGTPSGPLATPEFITREIGMRARVVGATRLGVELPLFGYRWNRDGTASIITYADAQALVRAEAGTFTRHQPSQFLTATGRDGWTIWLPDAVTIRSMIAAVERHGVRYIALAGVEGADPAITPAPSYPPARR